MMHLAAIIEHEAAVRLSVRSDANLPGPRRQPVRSSGAAERESVNFQCFMKPPSRPI